MNDFFSESEHPDLFVTPLKGKFLAEVSVSLREKRDAFIKEFDWMAKQGMVQLGGIYAVYSELADYLDTPKAKEFGFTLSEIEILLKQHLISPSDNFEDTIEQLRLAEGQPELEKRDMLTDALENHVALDLRSIFSACLAVQEGREADFQEVLDGYYADEQQRIEVEMLPELKEAQPVEKYQTLGEWYLSFAALSDQASGQKARGSLIAPLKLYEVKRARELYENLVADTLEIDTDSAAGRELLSKALQQIQNLVSSSQQSVA